MTSGSRLATILAQLLALLVAVSARSAHELERLNPDVVTHASDNFGFRPFGERPNPVLDVVNPAAAVVGLAKGVIIAIVVSVIVAIVLIVLCCVCICRACGNKKEVHTVVYTGNPNQQQVPQQYPPQQYPPQQYAPPTQQQQWQQGPPPASPQDHNAPPPAYPPGPAYVPPKKY